MSEFDVLLKEHAGCAELRGRVLRCTIATKAAGNSMDGARIVGATALLRAVAEGKTNAVGAVLLLSEGDSFCTGGDVKAFGAADDPAAAVTRMARTFHEFILAITRAPLPVIGSVHGWAAGAGMSIALACDIVVGGPATKFRPAYPTIGFSPDGGMSWSLPRLVGPVRARDLLITDGVVGGEEAERLGLISRLVPDERILIEAQLVAEELAEGPTSSLARIKRLAWESADHGFAEHLDHEARSIGEAAASPAGREGVQAFVERRPADYSGSW
jgi:2-(1,2-epoxy-1,2-dihydrophenyl)acetyl-CoA isomerase